MTALGKRVFAEGIGLIAERWNREPSLAMSATMAEWLNAQGCTAEEFIAGVKRAVAESQFPPSAKEILDYARPTSSADSRAGEVFARIVSLGRYIVPHGMRWELDVIERECGEPARRALVSIGGTARLIAMTETDRPFALRDFTKAFADFEREHAGRASTSRLLAAGAERRQLGPGAGSGNALPSTARKSLRSPAPIAGLVDQITAALPIPPDASDAP